MSTHKRDEELSLIRDGMPPILYSFYSGCVMSGFTPEQSLALTHTAVMAFMGKGVNIPNPPPNPDDLLES